MGLEYWQKTVWTAEDPSATSWYDECRWKETEFTDPNQQPGDDTGDEILEEEIIN